MRRLSFILSTAVALASLASCTKEEVVSSEPDVANASIPFALNADFAETKLVFDDSWQASWERNDIIYAVTTDQEWNTAVSFTFNGTQFTTSKTISNGTHTFNFIYTPYPQKGYHKGTGTTFNITENQSRNCADPKGNLKAHYPLAGQATVTTPAATLDAQMHHIATIVKVTIKNQTGADITLSRFKLDMPSERIAGMFNVKFDGTPRLERTSVYYNYTSVSAVLTNGALSAGAEVPVYLVIAPVEKYNGMIKFTVEDSTGKKYIKENAVVNLTFRAGTYNSATFTLK